MGTLSKEKISGYRNFIKQNKNLKYLTIKVHVSIEKVIYQSLDNQIKFLL